MPDHFDRKPRPRTSAAAGVQRAPSARDETRTPACPITPPAGRRSAWRSNHPTSLGPGAPAEALRAKIRAAWPRWFRPRAPRVCGCGSTSLTESHTISQGGRGARRTATFWHAIMHRREPDAANSKYWWRRVGAHPVLAQLPRPRLTKVGYAYTTPEAFVDFCEKVSRQRKCRRGSGEARAAARMGAAVSRGASSARDRRVGRGERASRRPTGKRFAVIGGPSTRQRVSSHPTFPSTRSTTQHPRNGADRRRGSGSESPRCRTRRLAVRRRGMGIAPELARLVHLARERHSGVRCATPGRR